jgi:hypothetical protein
MHSDDLGREFTTEDNGDGDENGEEPQPVISECRNKDRS